VAGDGGARSAGDGRLVGALGWLGVGILAGVGLLGILTIGIVLLALAGSLAALLIHRGLGAGWGSGVLAGLATATAYLAWTNGRGPGDICVVRGDEQACTQYLDPRPWALATAVLVALAVVLHVRLRPATATADA